MREERIASTRYRHVHHDGQHTILDARPEADSPGLNMDIGSVIGTAVDEDHARLIVDALNHLEDRQEGLQPEVTADKVMRDIDRRGGA